MIEQSSLIICFRTKADKHRHQEIYIKQAKALVNLVGNYGKTDLDKAKDSYDILEKLADKCCGLYDINSLMLVFIC
jgi:5-methylthioribose kinase